MNVSGSSRVLGALESETMGVLWSSEHALSVRQVLDSLNVRRNTPLAYTTVMTVMRRLQRKGVLERERSGRGFPLHAGAGRRSSHRRAGGAQ